MVAGHIKVRRQIFGQNWQNMTGKAFLKQAPEEKTSFNVEDQPKTNCTGYPVSLV